MAKQLSKQDWIGKRYGRWTIVDVWLPRSALARCDCGTEKVVDRHSLRDGSSSSCGCLCAEVRSKAHRIHGMTNSRTWLAWRNLRGRCTKAYNSCFESYGARGIHVADRWLSFENFLVDMGEVPGPDYSIERIDNDGNYEPGNCRWATPKEQARNRRSTFWVEAFGRRASLAEHAEEYGVHYKLAWKRIRQYGWSPERALTADRLF